MKDYKKEIVDLIHKTNDKKILRRIYLMLIVMVKE